jgi:hypothetical protein
MRLTISFAVTAAPLALGSASATPSIPLRQHAEAAPLAATPVIDWSNEARRAIVPSGPSRAGANCVGFHLSAPPFRCERRARQQMQEAVT